MTTTAPTRFRLTTRTRFRLTSRTRKLWLLAHIVAAGLWLGIDLVLGILVTTALTTADPTTIETAYRALSMFAITPLIAVSLATFATGVVLAWGTKYGLIRYWWVATKLALNIVLTLLIIFGLSETIRTTAANASLYSLEGPPDISSLLAPPIVSTAALLFATVLSVFKPWGRIKPST